MIQEENIKGVIAQRWSSRARTYDKSPGHGIHSEQEKRAWMSILSESLDYEKGMKILDAGVGTGALALLLGEMGHRVFGIDLSKNMLDLARSKANARDLNIDFRIGDAESPPFEKTSFNAIVCRHLLWTLPNPERALKAWKNLLKQGGRVVIIDGNWGRNKKTLKQHVWRFFAMPLIFVTELRDPRLQNQDLEPYLPMRQRKRPEEDIRLLERLGFEAKVIEVEIPRRYSWFSYIKYGHSQHSKHQFVVTGTKKG